MGRRIAEECVNPPNLLARRPESLRFLSDTAAKLPDARARRPNLLADDRPSRAIDFALVQFLIQHLGYPDKALAVYLSKGMPLAGDVPPAGVFPKRLRPCGADYQSWSTGMPQRNRERLDRVKREAGSERAKWCWEKTLVEQQHGWVTKPVPVADAAMESLPLSPRFATEAKHG